MNRNILVLFVVCALFSCSNKNKINLPDVYDSKELNYVDTRVYILDQCPITEDSQEWIKRPDASKEGLVSTLLASAAAPAIKHGLAALSTAIRKVAAPEDFTKTISTSSYFYSIDEVSGLTPNTKLGCIVVVKGLFVSSESKNEAFKDKDIISKSGFKNLNLATDPLFYYEAVIEISENPKEFRLLPKYYILNENFKNDYFGRNKDIILTYTFKSVTSEDKENTFAVIINPLPNIDEGEKLNKSILSSIKTKWNPSMPISSDLESLLAKISQNKTNRKSIRDSAIEFSKSNKFPSENEIKKIIEALKFKNLDIHEYYNNLGEISTTLSNNKSIDSETTISNIQQQSTIIEQERSTNINIFKRYNEYIELISLAENYHKENIKFGGFSFDNVSPFNLEVTITETTEASDFLLAVANFVGDEDLKTSLGETIKSELTKDKKQQKIEKRKTKTTNTVTALDSLKTFNEKKAELDALNSNPTSTQLQIKNAEIELEKAKIQALANYKNAGIDDIPEELLE